MAVIAMSRTEIDRMSVLQDLAAGRIKVTGAATLMSLGRRQVFRLAKAFAQRGPEAWSPGSAAGREGQHASHAEPPACRSSGVEHPDRTMTSSGMARTFIVLKGVPAPEGFTANMNYCLVWKRLGRKRGGFVRDSASISTAIRSGHRPSI
jgi:hypothetical protein